MTNNYLVIRNLLCTLFFQDVCGHESPHLPQSNSYSLPCLFVVLILRNMWWNFLGHCYRRCRKCIILLENIFLVYQRILYLLRTKLIYYCENTSLQWLTCGWGSCVFSTSPDGQCLSLDKKKKLELNVFQVGRSCHTLPS